MGTRGDSPSDKPYPVDSPHQPEIMHGRRMPPRRSSSPSERRKNLANNLSPQLQQIAQLLDRAPQEKVQTRYILELMFEELASLNQQIANAKSGASGSTASV